MQNNKACLRTQNFPPTSTFPTLLALALLTSCGGGASGENPELAPAHNTADEGPVSVHWGGYGLFDSLAEDSSEDYLGAKNLAAVHTYDAAEVVSIVLNGPGQGIGSEAGPLARYHSVALTEILELPEDDVLLSMQLSEDVYRETECLTGHFEFFSVAAVHDSTAVQVLITEYHNCRLGQNETNASETYYDGIKAVAWKGDIRNNPPLYVGFDDYSISSANISLELHGALKRSQNTECPSNSQIELALGMSNLDAGDSYLFDQFTYATNSDSGDCSQAYSEWTVLDGTFFHSVWGRWDVTTKSATPILYDSNSPLTVSPAATVGDSEIVFKGDLEGKAVLKYLTPDLLADDQVLPPIVVLEITDSLTSEMTSAQSAAAAFKGGALLDIFDTDDDGLPNGWEAYYDLDPHIHTEVSVDSDGDGWNLLAEYERAGSPHDGVDLGAKIDLSIALELKYRASPEPEKLDFVVLVSGTRSSEHVMPIDRVFEVALTGDAYWDNSRLPGSCKSLSENLKVLRCHYGFSGEESPLDFHFYPLFIIPLSENTVEVTARFTDNNYDYLSQNNQAADQFGVTMDPSPRFLDLSAQELFMVSAGLTQMSMSFTQAGIALPLDLDIEINIPNGISVRNADLQTTGNSSLISRCSITEKILCKIEGVELGDELTLDLDFYVTDAANHTLNLEFFNVRDDERTTIGQFTSELSYIDSTDELQALIDVAVEGSTVSLPGGVFFGNLDGRSKTLYVTGSLDPLNPTVITSSDSDVPMTTNIGPRSVYSHLRFESTGAPVSKRFGENVTFSNLVISPFEGMPHHVESLLHPFGGESYRLADSRIEGWGASDDGTCESLFRADGVGSYEILIFIEKNIIANNHCQELILVEGGKAPKYYVQNNTFLNNPQLFRYSGIGDLSYSHYKNNIIVGSDKLLMLENEAFSNENSFNLHVGNELTSARNLVWNSERGSFLTRELLENSNFVLEASDLNRDPLFVNERDGDYSLKAQSPAIDVGVLPTAYRWSYTDYLNENLVPDVTMPMVPFDGNGDGVKAYDLGAFEYQENPQ